jgi:hypothetical protein
MPVEFGCVLGRTQIGYNNVPRSQFITNLDRAFPVGKFESWERCRELFPHATLALGVSLNDRSALLRQASLLENGA